jgi:hypothetical protein
MPGECICITSCPWRKPTSAEIAELNATYKSKLLDGPVTCTEKNISETSPAKDGDQ